MKNPHFSQLAVAATLGGLSAIIISGLSLFLIFNGNTSSSPLPGQEIYERGSGRNELKEQIATDSDETDETSPPPRRREKTEVAIDELPLPFNPTNPK